MQTGALSGNWQMTLQSTTLSETESQSGFLIQAGNTVTGSVQFSGQTFSDPMTGTTTTVCEGVGPALGQTTGSNVALVVSTAGQTVNLTGTSANNSTSMSGNYSILAAGCGQTEIGTWTANQVIPLTGSFAATFTPYSSSEYTNVFHFTGMVTQGSNTGGSTTTLSGSMMSSDLPCFSSATLAGVVSGTSVVFNLLTPTGITLGKLSGTLTTDATQINNAAFAFTNATDPSVLGICDQMGIGTRGTATIAVQPSSAT